MMLADNVISYDNVRVWKFAKAHHFCTFDGCLPVMPQVPPFLHFFPQYRTV